VEARAGLQSEAIARALHAAFCRGVVGEELCKLAATKMHEAGHPYDVVSIFTHCAEGGLKLAARGEMPGAAGQPVAVGREPSTRKRAAIGQTRGDRFPDDGLRDSSTAVLVVEIRGPDEVLGEIHIEAEAPRAFSSAERTAVESVAAALAALL
jgi:GAF domain-containing protein